MENTKRTTKKEYFAMIREVVAGNEELVAFVDHEVELLNKKSTGKTKTKMQIKNEALVEDIYNYLVGMEAPVTVTELIEKAEIELTNQKVSALLKKLVDAGRVAKVIDKKKSYFSAI